MADAEPPGGHSQRHSRLRGAAEEPDLRRRTWRAVDHYVGERDARTEARAERLEHCLLGGESPGQALDPIGALADFLKFGLHEAAWNQRIARILDPAPHLGDFDEIDPVPDDVHKKYPSLSQTPDNTPNTVDRRLASIES